MADTYVGFRMFRWPPAAAAGSGGWFVLKVKYFFDDQEVTISTTASQNLHRLPACFTGVEDYVRMMKAELSILKCSDLPLLQGIRNGLVGIARFMKEKVEKFAGDGLTAKVEFCIKVVARREWLRRVRRMKEIMIWGEERRTECAICLNEFAPGMDSVFRTPCRHVFHRSCIGRWFETAGTCPVCRSDFDNNYSKIFM